MPKAARLSSQHRREQPRTTPDIFAFETNTATPIKIYDGPTGPYPARVRIARAEKNLQSDVEFVPANLWKADIAVIGGFIFAAAVKLPIPQECEALLAWFARMLERLSVREQLAIVPPKH